MRPNRYNVTFSISQLDIGEEYLGEINVRDTFTHKMYTFPLTGESNTFDMEFINNNEIGDVTVYVEEFEGLKLEQIHTYDEALQEIDDYKEGVPLETLIGEEDSVIVTQTILQHYYSYSSLPVQLISDDVQVNIADYIVNQEIGKLLARSVEKPLTKNKVLNFAHTIDKLDIHPSYYGKKLLMPELMKSINNNKFTEREANKVNNMLQQLNGKEMELRISEIEIENNSELSIGR